ncbi:MAG TPA: AI-2E family transporter [Candidatus Saccharimonadales bacterium]|nr:AI-2E family transporter [Candidatus Saccharimonadales bacterium]
MPRKIEISHKTIVFTFLLIAGIWFVWLIRDIVLLLFVALLIMVILNPLVKRLSVYRIPRAISVLIVYVLFFGLVVICVAELVPVLIEQTKTFSSVLPNYINNLHLSSAINEQISTQILSRLGDLPGSVLGVGIGIVSNIVTFLTVLVFAFYLLMARNKIDDQLSYFLGEKRANDIAGFIDELELKLGGWARGQMLLMFTVGFFNYLGFQILGVPYALPLGIFAGIMEVVPYAGPIIGAVPAVVIGFGISPLIGGATIALAFLIQQVENYVLVPKIMEKSVGVSPIVILLALTVGLKLAGITGVLISIPLVITLQVLIRRKFLV